MHNIFLHLVKEILNEYHVHIQRIVENNTTSADIFNKGINYIVPAFLDKRTGSIYPCKLFHSLDELPIDIQKEFWKTSNTHIIDGFLNKQTNVFYTREEVEQLIHNIE